jgi:TPR repeat protein
LHRLFDPVFNNEINLIFAPSPWPSTAHKLYGFADLSPPLVELCSRMPRMSGTSQFLYRFIVVFAVVIGTGCSQSEDDASVNAAATMALIRDDYKTALPLFRRLADHGNANAEYALGGMYREGLGVRKDDAQAVMWFRRAGDNGNADAQTALGFMIANGLGVPRDDSEAVKWYRSAADQGKAAAQSAPNERR